MTPKRYLFLICIGLAPVFLLPNVGSPMPAVGLHPGGRAKVVQAAGDLLPLGELARSVAETPMVVKIPSPKGKAKYSIEKKHRTYTLASGETRVMLAQLPKFTTPYTVKIRSMCNCFGFSKTIFVPRGAFLDERFQQTRELDETEFTAVTGGGWQLDLDVEIGDDRKDDAYLLLYTAGSGVGQRLGRFRDAQNGLVLAAIGWPVSRAEHCAISFETSLPKK